MENNTKRYWQGLEELRNDAEFVKHAQKEFGDTTLIEEGGTARRDFLKMLGFGMAAVSLAACEAPVRKAIPYLNKPEDVEPTIPTWYASTYTDPEGGDYCSVLVKTREGRPIKIEGNPESSISRGGTGTRAQASVLGLYDNEKLKGPQKGDKATSWETLDTEVRAALAGAQNIRIVAGTILSPSTRGVIEAFQSKFPSAQLVQYDANSAFGLTQVHGGAMPDYDFSKASVIVGLSCDFLGSWVAPDEFSRQWAQNRKLVSTKGGKNTMSRHYQFESAFSLTGANADYRTSIKPSQEGLVAAQLLKLLGGTLPTPSITVPHLDKAARDLQAAGAGRALVVSGSNDPAVQTVVAEINRILGSYGSTIAGKSNYKQGNDVAMNRFIDDVKARRVDAVIFYGANPVYNHPRGKELAEALPNVKLRVSMSDRIDETGLLCQYMAPDSHYLESWGDAEPKPGFYSLCQPTISTIFKTRQGQVSLLSWADFDADFSEYLKSYWLENILQGGGQAAWVKVLQDGVYEPGSPDAALPAPSGNLAAAATRIGQVYKPSDRIELVTYEKPGIGTGSQANNPWLQEFPDPISRATWDNYAAISQRTAAKLELAQNDVVRLEVAGREPIELPVLVQPGQVDDTIAVAIGYGRTRAGKSADGVGKNAYPFTNLIAPEVKVTDTGDDYKWGIAQTQTHNTVMGRKSIIQESVLGEYQKDVQAGRFFPHVATSEGIKRPEEISLWKGHIKPNHSWGMVIDLNSCTGCGACVISCQAENNVAVVGRKEVVMRREMHWLRIDRYYSSDAESDGFNYKALEVASENPEVVFQPMLCQHCSNAPCETVCPVIATSHSAEGLNQMTYNRCIGTRYCANNCPYKVRRFNWFKYFDEDRFDFHYNNELGKMVINPDVTVRSRGVMEKCTFCVQRIQATKLTAKKERRRPYANEVQTACSQSCPTNAIAFGDFNNPESEVSKLLAAEKQGRAFSVLEEINVLPQISYLTKIRNKDLADAKFPRTEDNLHHAEKDPDHA